MRVFVAGATGDLGRALVRAFAARGHSVVGLARSPENAATLRRLGAEPHPGNLFDRFSLYPGVEGCDAVVHAATSIPAGRARPRDFAANDRVRRDGTRALADAAARAGARIYLQQSVVWAFGTPDGGPFDELAPGKRHFTTDSALDGERIARASGAPVAVIRLGMLYGPESPHLLRMRDAALRRRLPRLGRVAAPKAFVQVDDAAAAFVAVAEARATGVWHCVDGAPIPWNGFVEELARAIGAPPPRRAPVWLARLLLGDAIRPLLLEPTVTSAAALRASTGWTAAYPSVREGLRAAAEAWGTRATAPTPRGLRFRNLEIATDLPR